MYFLENKEQASATLEYVLITIFGLIVTISDLKVVYDIYDKKINELNEKLGLEIELEGNLIDEIFSMIFDCFLSSI